MDIYGYIREEKGKGDERSDERRDSERRRVRTE